MLHDTVAYLLGTWHVDRELVDHRAGVAGTFRGTAVFRDLPGDGPHGARVVEHAEEGELAWGGVVGPAGRTLHLHPEADGSAHVTFADGREFHDLDLRPGRWSAHHPCAADDYAGTFTVVSPDEWRVRWDVSGPTKDHTLVTVYRRA
ncbi:DUF6314 family protein [Cellulomonas sp. NS3]|uniref:DUF6314 family protein n=1 Tax=Cellulomonas sp. NS3 TaxID=2973977 RepID=UPI002163F79F|nr:DUF6314 family protein [Cellulomonas sp. NS3]